MRDSPGQGYRLEGRGSDLAVEVWGPDLSACLAAAVSGFGASFATPRGDGRRLRVPVAVAGDEPATLLLALLDEALFRLDVHGEVAVGFAAGAVGQGRVEGTLEVVPLADTELVGAVPKAVTWHDLELAAGEDGWRGHVVLDL